MAAGLVADGKQEYVGPNANANNASNSAAWGGLRGHFQKGEVSGNGNGELKMNGTMVKLPSFI